MRERNIPPSIAKINYKIFEFGINFTALEKSLRLETIGVWVIFLILQDRPKIIEIVWLLVDVVLAHQVLTKTVECLGK